MHALLNHTLHFLGSKVLVSAKIPKRSGGLVAALSERAAGSPCSEPCSQLLAGHSGTRPHSPERSLRVYPYPSASRQPRRLKRLMLSGFNTNKYQDARFRLRSLGHSTDFSLEL